MPDPRIISALALVVAVSTLGIVLLKDDDPVEMTINGSVFELPELCADVFAPGQPTDDVTAWLDESGSCTDDNGGIQLVAGLTYDCPDGRDITSTDFGLGAEGGRWHAPLGEGFTIDDLTTAACSETMTTTT